MKKKILALLMVMVLAMTALAGCGDKKDDKKSSGTKEAVASEDSCFFKEMEKVAEMGPGCETIHLKYVIKSEEFANQDTFKEFLDADGNLAVDLTAEVTTESNEKVAVDVSATIGSKINGKMLTVVVDGEELYLEYSGLLNVLKEYKDNEQIASVVQQIESNFGSAIKLNTKTVSEAVSPLIDSILENAAASGDEDSQLGQAIIKTYMAVLKDVIANPDSMKDLSKTYSELAEKHFANLEGTDGDMYTLTISADNIDKVLEDTENLLKEDGQKVLEDTVAYLYKVSGENALGKSEDEIKGQIPGWVEEASKAVSENKEEAIKFVKDAKIESVMKTKVNDKDAKFEITMKMDADGATVDYTASMEFTEGTKSIQDKIPTNANDITTMITTLVNMYGSQLTGAAAGASDSTTDIY
jgi:hypothetical protein